MPDQRFGPTCAAIGFGLKSTDRLEVHATNVRLKVIMIPVGYLAKRVNVHRDWLQAACVADVYSVSGCVSEAFADYINYWKHNGYWFFDSPQIIQNVALENGIDLTGTKLFFYEAHEFEFDDSVGQWKIIAPEPSFKTQVVLPDDSTLEGYDVVTFSCGTTAECSPLSCNMLAAELETNQHCLLASFERAKRLIEEGTFENTEPGPFRILAVYSTKWP